jgi:hypothetical protein
MTPSKLSRRRIRIHEAGHAVIARALGRDVDCLVVFAGDGATHLEPTWTWVARAMSPADRRVYVEGDAMIDLAGEAALEVFGDPDPRGGADVDRAGALRSAHSLDPTAPGAAVARLYQRTLALARQHRAVIERFAESLAANGDRLAGDQLRPALDAAERGWPTPRFDSASESRILTRKRALFEGAVRDTDNAIQRIELMRDAEATAWAGVSLAEYRRDGLYAPAVTTVAIERSQS